MSHTDHIDGDLLVKCVESKCAKEKEDVPLGHFCTESSQCAIGIACAPDAKCGGIGAACDLTKQSCYSGKSRSGGALWRGPHVADTEHHQIIATLPP